MLVYSYILARSGSKSIKDKNIFQIKKKPLIYFTIRESLKSNLINETFVFTDSKKYADISYKYGAKIPFLRPKMISKDLTTDLETINYCNNRLLKNFPIPDMIVLLRPTSPLRNYKTIDSAINIFKKKMKKFTSLRSVELMPESSYKTFTVNKKNILCAALNNSMDMDYYNKPRQFFPLTYKANGYIDIITPSFLIKDKSLYGKKSYAFITEPTIDVDSLYDLEMLKLKLKI